MTPSHVALRYQHNVARYWQVNWNAGSEYAAKYDHKLENAEPENEGNFAN